MRVSTVAHIGDAVRQERRRQGLRQADLALLAGTGERFVREFEQGKETARVGQVLQVIAALGITLDLHVPEVPSDA